VILPTAGHKPITTSTQIPAAACLGLLWLAPDWPGLPLNKLVCIYSVCLHVCANYPHVPSLKSMRTRESPPGARPGHYSALELHELGGLNIGHPVSRIGPYVEQGSGPNLGTTCPRFVITSLGLLRLAPGLPQALLKLHSHKLVLFSHCSVLNPCMLRFESGNGLWLGQFSPKSISRIS
jgi:hypothetical protein